MPVTMAAHAYPENLEGLLDRAMDMDMDVGGGLNLAAMPSGFTRTVVKAVCWCG